MIESYKVLELLGMKPPARNSKCQRKTHFEMILYVNVCYVCLLINVLATPSPSLELVFVCLSLFKGFFFI